MAQKNPFKFALYISLFPQLVAGPIIRYHDIAEQLSNRKVAVDDFAYGIERFIVGLGKKVIIANTLGGVADKIFAVDPHYITCQVSWLGIICYTLQIYFDFSGYSDMAIGLCRLFGFHILENFNYPYISKSIKEFWRRWHISLSNWFRDYLYIPLGGNRCSPIRSYFNLTMVFFLCGLWHGASWSFVIWGIYHGIFLVVERTRFAKWLERRWKVFQHVYALMVVIVGWVFFRSDSLSYALGYLAAMFGFGHGVAAYTMGMYLNYEVGAVLLLGAFGSTPIAHYMRQKIASLESYFYSIWFSLTRYLSFLSILLISTFQLAIGSYNPFIYFRF